MAEIQHVVTAAGAPSAAPPSIGAHYIDTLSGASYIATGTATVDDWGNPLAEAGETAQYNSVATLDLSAGVPASFIWLNVPGGTARAVITLPLLSGVGPGSQGISTGAAMTVNRFALLVLGDTGLGGFSEIEVKGPVGAQVFCNVASETPDAGRSAVFTASSINRIEVELFSDHVLLSVTALSFPTQPAEPI